MGKSENPSENPSGNPLKMLMFMILWDFPHDFPMDLNSFWPHVIQPHGSTEHWQAWPHPGGEIWRLKIKWDTAKIDLKGTILMRSLMIKHGIWGFQILRQPRKTATRKSSNSVPCAVLSLQLFWAIHCRFWNGSCCDFALVLFVAWSTTPHMSILHIESRAAEVTPGLCRQARLECEGCTQPSASWPLDNDKEIFHGFP